MNDDTVIDRNTTGWRIGQVIGTIATVVCAVFGIPLWWNYVTFAIQLSDRGPFDQTEVGFMIFGFLIWLIPVFAGILIIIGSFGWKNKILAKIITAIGGVMTIAAIAVSVIAAT